jgi:hypothetical protein
MEIGRTTAATVIDHRTPHKGSQELFWQVSNWMQLCKHHHDSTKQSLERGGKMRGADGEGNPTSPAHHWNMGDGIKT